jgi:hypothetical protein
MRERQRGRRTFAGVGVGLLALVGLVGTRQAAVASSISGGGQLNATVTLNQFPCPFPSACTAGTSGGFRGTFTGTDVAGKAFSLTFPDPTTIPPVSIPPNFSTSSLTFTDDCNPPTSAPTILDTGTGDGTFTIAGGLLTRGTVQSHGAMLQGGVHFERTATEMTMRLSGMDVLTSTSTVVASGLLAEGDVTFIVSAADLTASCDHINVSPSTATIAGEVVSFA